MLPITVRLMWQEKGGANHTQGDHGARGVDIPLQKAMWLRAPPEQGSGTEGGPSLRGGEMV